MAPHGLQVVKVGNHVLHQAVKAGNLKRIKRLVNLKNIDIQIVTVGILMAMDSKHPKKLRNEIIKILISHPEAYVNIATKSENEAIDDRAVLLHRVIYEGDVELVKTLVKHTNICLHDMSEGISVAISSEYLCKPSNEKLQNSIIKILLEHPDIDVNFKTNDGLSALHNAVIYEQVKTVEALLEHPKIDVNQLSDIPAEYHKMLPGRKSSALIISMRQNKTTDITKLLLEHPDIDVNLTNQDICLPTSLNLWNEKMLTCFEMLLNHHRINMNIIDQFIKSYPLVIRAQAVEDNRDKEDRQVLAKKAFKLLLNHDKIDHEIIKDKSGRNLLHQLVLYVKGTFNDNNSENEEEFKNHCEMISEMVENHPNLVTIDNEGKTPVDLAMELPDSFTLLKDTIEKYLDKIANVGTEKKSPKSEKDKETKCCWKCDKKGVKLYKCKGCKKAYYCSKNCLNDDWSIHGRYCIKKQQKMKNEK